jgi:hypothetical protein
LVRSFDRMIEAAQWDQTAAVRSVNAVCSGRRHEIVPFLHLQPDGRDFGRRPGLHGHQHVDSPTALSGTTFGVDPSWGIANGEHPGNRTAPTLGGSKWAGPDTTVTRRLRGLRLGYVTRLCHLRRGGHRLVPRWRRCYPSFPITEARGPIVPDWGRGHTPAAAARPSLSRWMVDQDLPDRGQDRRRATSRRAGAATARTRRGTDTHNERASSYCWTELIFGTKYPVG